MKIDIGCGERPRLGYDVYTDIYTPNVKVNGKFVICNMESMPFNDKEFDYARCHHVIEHTDDPDKACRELIRIAKAGVLYFPTPQAEMLFGKGEHNWFVFQDQLGLIFVAKRLPSYGIEMMCTKGAVFNWINNFVWVVIRK